MSISFISPVSPLPQTPARQLRAKTLRQTLESKQNASPTPKNSRKVLTSDQTLSLTRESNHDCSRINELNTVAKTQMRIDFSLFRFCLDYGWHCESFRGRTHYNGSQPACRGRCEAAHAALSPTLYDNQLTLIIQKMEKVAFSILPAHEQKYLEKRFNLTEQEKPLLDSSNISERTGLIQNFVNSLKPGHAKGSFMHGTIDKNRNSTFENPRACNRVDCTLEAHLRKIEDQLAEKCRNNQIHPMAAIDSLKSEYKQLLKEIKKNLEDDKNHLEALLIAWKEILKAQTAFEKSSKSENDFNLYLDSIKKYWAAHQQRFNTKEKKGVSKLQELNTFLQQYQSPYVLHIMIQKSTHFANVLIYYEVNKSHLSIPPNDGKDDLMFKNVISEVSLRIEETEIQLKTLDKTAHIVYSTFLHLFGSKDSQGTLLTADEIADKLVELIEPASQCKTPERASRKRKDLEPKQRSSLEDSFNLNAEEVQSTPQTPEKGPPRKKVKRKLNLDAALSI